MNRMLSFCLLAAAWLLSGAAMAAGFDEWFVDRTLRIDCQLSGDASRQAVCVDALSQLPQWAGRRTRLAELPLRGNGQVEVADEKSGEVIYRNSFSSLFLEWLETDEAKTECRSFEHTVLVPMPKAPVVVRLTLCNGSQQTVASATARIDPADILIAKKGERRITPHKYLLQSGSCRDCIDIAIMAEGYTAEEMPLFLADAQAAADTLMSTVPFCELRDRFNIVAVMSESADSGVSVPREGVWKTTAVSSHFDTFYSDRYLTTRSVRQMNDALAGIPYEHIIVLANSSTYGGGGIYNDYTLTAAHHSKFQPVVVHEFGHSFGGLADEYFYDDDVMTDTYCLTVEPWEQNVTTLVDFASKWQDMIPARVPQPTPTDKAKRYPVGLYEGGAYASKGIYRGSFDCRMRTNEAPAFCPVCQRALRRLIEFYTN